MSHFRNEDVERPVEAVRVENLGAVLANFLQRAEASLSDGGVVRVQQLTQPGQQVWPVVMLALQSKSVYIP